MALYRIGTASSRAGQAGDRAQVMHGEPPFWAAGYSRLPGNRRGRLEHVPAEFCCAGQQLPGEVAGVRHEVCWLGRLAGEGLFRPGRSR